MKIVIVSKALVIGSYRRKLVELARCGLEVHAVVPPFWKEAGAIQMLEDADDDGFALHVTPMRLNGHFHVHFYPQLRRLLDSIRPDLVHLDEEPFNFATFHGALAARRLNIPFVFFSWQNLLRSYPSPFRDMERANYRWASGALAGSTDVVSVLRAKGYRGEVTMIPQFGVDPQVFTPVKRAAEPFTVGFLNRFVEGKAPLLALDAFAGLPADARLLMVGDGPLRDQVCARVRTLRLAGRVEIQSRVSSDRMPEILQSLDALILPSVQTQNWKEQFGRVLIEGMATGIPVVGSDSGEIPIVLGDAGLVTPAGDASALYRALQRLYDHPELRADLGRRGRDRVLEKFTHAQIAAQTAWAYRRAVLR